jgi:hypothetical protein
MDIRETLYNSEVMKELRKDNWTVTLRKKIGDKNYALTFTNIRQDWENSPRTLGITIKPLWKKTRTTEEREALEANKFRNFTDVPAWMSLKRRIWNDMRMEVYDKAGGWAWGKSYFVEIKEGVWNIEINDTLFQISESGSSYSIEKVSNNIASIDTDVE